MSDQQPPRTAGSSRHRNPWVTALLILIGIILLLPGLCSLIFFWLTSVGPGGNAEFLPLLISLAGAGGVALIVFAIRR